MSAANQLLNPRQTAQKVTRMAYEICEQNLEESNVIVAGIFDEGYRLAQMLVEQLRAIAPFTVELLQVKLDKTAATQPNVLLDNSSISFENQAVVLVDDVLNSGRTLTYALAPFLAKGCKKLQVAVLVERSHRTFPIRADFVGYALATTIQEHISVQLSEAESVGVYLG
ncbi:pyrimidine operon attenuation protein / uracil phosphoribosyltransferase [Flexibacter flexilis DSM 6793]|uniref:Pyrimidine operon attenuation protein / uracil phosphoribosyltransferase n=1 Tax=Flexibacter flexilis DSM 6793 TaxID=927664 RepID=A0A1I1FLT9_9BACT|nr:phosphoribosyltransferase family protein [Flexibacter flexilis]SFC00275.1 pyrimidine operon attenuation protein / uracil phosphoribosyltransferase [Flexibacter flexilis DSM 6793]